MERMTVDEIIAKYPDKWIFLVNLEWDSEGEVTSGVIEGIYSDDEMDKVSFGGSRGFGYFFRTIVRETFLGCLVS